MASRFSSRSGKPDDHRDQIYSGGPKSAGVEQLQAYARAGNIKSVHLIHSKDRDPEVKILSLSPLTFTVGIDQIRSLLSGARLLDTLRRERIRFAHSAS